MPAGIPHETGVSGARPGMSDAVQVAVAGARVGLGGLAGRLPCRLAALAALLLDPDHAPTGGPLEDLMFRIHELLAPVVDCWIEPPAGVAVPAADPELVAGLQSRFPAGQPTM